MNKSLRLALRLANDLNITVVMASQLKRAPDQLMRYQPPQATDLAGSSDKERGASVVLGLWRPLRDDIPLKEAREMAAKAKAGSGQEETIYKPMTMGVKVLKDRLGDAPGRHIQLHVGRGNRLEMDQGATHGIRTHGGIL
jgi:hypothetical protein